MRLHGRQEVANMTVDEVSQALEARFQRLPCTAIRVALVGVATFACSAEPLPRTAPEDSPTAEAQAERMKGAPIAPKRTRFRRHAAAAVDDPRHGAPYPPYDLRGTLEAKLAQGQAKIVAENTSTTGWEATTPEGRTRLIYEDENGDEWEEEYSLADLQRLREFAENRGINRPSSFAGIQVAPPLTGPDLNPQAWSNGNDAKAAERHLAKY